MLSTGFNTNFLVKGSAGGISKFIMQYFVIRIFSHFNSCLFDACFDRTGFKIHCVFFSLKMCCYCSFFYFSIFNISVKCSFALVSKSPLFFLYIMKLI